jgi:uncharacterized RDD family membrane protein YckC
MDFSWLIWFLVCVVVLSIAFAILKYLIMPVVPAPAQPAVWAIIGVCLLIGLLVFFGGGYYHGASLGLRR